MAMLKLMDNLPRLSVQNRGIDTNQSCLQKFTSFLELDPNQPLLVVFDFDKTLIDCHSNKFPYAADLTPEFCFERFNSDAISLINLLNQYNNCYISIASFLDDFDEPGKIFGRKRIRRYLDNVFGCDRTFLQEGNLIQVGMPDNQSKLGHIERIRRHLSSVRGLTFDACQCIVIDDNFENLRSAANAGFWYFDADPRDKYQRSIFKELGELFSSLEQQPVMTAP